MKSIENAVFEKDYERIDQLVFDYQKGDTSAGEELLELFDPYIKKYWKIIKDGMVNLSDKDTKRFISLFMKDEENRRLTKKRYHSGETKSAIDLTASRLSATCRSIPAEDMMQELITIFLLIAKRYKKRRGKANFCGYLYNVYKYEVYRRIVSMTSDPLVHRIDLNESYNDLCCMNEEEQILNEPAIYTDEILMVLDEQLGNNWVRGLTCGEAFEILDPTERLILKLKYVERLTDIEIGRMMGVHRNTIRLQREKAIDTISKFLGDNGELH
jgi:RNA polymerase sigma factor (sigma-70 family)